MAATAPQAAIEHVPVATLRPDPSNPRRITDAEEEELARSIQAFGFNVPIVARRADGLIIGGHQRLRAAIRLGLDTVPVIFVDLGIDQARLLSVALNKISGTWDNELLARAFAELPPGIDATLSGFDSDEITKLLRSLDAREKRDRPEPSTSKPRSSRRVRLPASSAAKSGRSMAISL